MRRPGRLCGPLLVATGIIHIGYGVAMGWDDVVALFGDGIGSAAAGSAQQESWFWFLVAGLPMLLAGQLVNALSAPYTAAWVRWERQGHRRCIECGSYAVTEGTCPRCGAKEPYLEAWSAVPLDEDERAARLAEPCIPSSDISTFLSADDF